MSSHISSLRSLIRQLAKVKARVDDEDAKAILLKDMILALLAEEKRTNEEDLEGVSQLENTLYAQNHNKISSTSNEDIICFCCKKKGYRAWSCKNRARDVLQEKFKDKINEENISYVENGDPSNGQVIIYDSLNDSGEAL